jgi:L-ascorbate metabolism protein UlaG (beta-lactamase superfamily)
MSNLYLKSNIKMEPLIWNWYAWPYLIPPATAGCNIVERHLKIMQSYIQNPQIHAQAVKDPQLLGGPFVDLEGEKVEEIKNLISQTKKDCQDLIVLNNSLKELDRILQLECDGDSLEELYSKVPSPLRGLVELVYDLNHHPSIRLIEPLIYNKYYSSNHQKISLSEIHSDYRKFILSTPRVDNDEIYISIPFSDSKLDKLFRMREHHGDIKEIQDLLNIPEEKQKGFYSLFTDITPVLPEDRIYNQDGVRIRYFGHACILVQTKSVSILFDPVISYPISDTKVPRFTLKDLPDYIDYVIITHNHQDHLMFETLLQLRYKIGHVVFAENCGGALQDPSVKLILQYTGFHSLIELKEMEAIKIEDGEIVGLPFFGEHGDLNIQSKLSYCIKLKDKNFMFAADSNNLEPALYDYLSDFLGSIDMLFLGMECDGAPLTWLYGPLLTQQLKRSYDSNRTLSGSNFEKAWSIAQRLKCKEAYIYAMGQEPWLNFVMALKYLENSPQIIESNKFVQECIKNGIKSERLFGKKEWIII